MKTKEDKGAQYSKSIIDSFGIKGVPCGIKDIQQMIADGFIAGVNHIMSLPLASRLTAEERKKIKTKYEAAKAGETMADSPECGFMADLLEDIFGKAMFCRGRRLRKSPDKYMPLVRRTLADFDFSKVHKYMESVNWTWDLNEEPHVPSIGKLYQKAEILLIRAAKNKCCHSSGGFQAYADNESIELSFTIAESSCNINELAETK